uniref:BTB domain-containing protein n=1 Tax=Alexandrium catenella TaxID=2925 RepID=A0A7S1RKA6_ALECA|mmetsp:Transcript_62115/g.166238  ORF Transcript_62115/g.166238 Transcript_62115/m.166238 type:complete len:322 (+) Transcript_62115:25-990(+)
MDSGELASVEHHVRFDYWLPFTAASNYQKGDPARSPTTLVGRCPVCLLVFPRGTQQTGNKVMSAFVEVCARDDWLDGWEFTKVHYKIEVKNVDSKKDVSKSDSHDFKAEVSDRGWHDIVKCGGYADLKAHGWVFPDDTVRFHVRVSGGSLGDSKRKLEDTNHGPRMWRDMKFTDMCICAEEGGAELPCHRAVLAVSSPVFDRMMATDMKEGSERRLVLRNASIQTLRCLLEYLYTSSLPEAAVTDVRSLRELLRLADQYELRDLLRRCASCLVELMSPANIRDVLSVLKTYPDHPEVDKHLQQAKKKARRDDAMFDALVNT